MDKGMQHKELTAMLIADYLLLKAQQEGVQVTNKKLQKLLYYVQAWSLALNDKKAFEDKIEAWVHGPAIKSVYLEFQKFGASPITKDVDPKITDAIPVEVTSVINEVWKVYSGFDGNYLEYLTHSETPWKAARENLEPHESSENEISVESMREFYKAKKAELV